MNKRGFHKVIWDKEPQPFENLSDGIVRINTNIKPYNEQYESISCDMTYSEAAAYLGAMHVNTKREHEIVDETILNLIEEGSL